jgi:hypothetical protein
MGLQSSKNIGNSLSNFLTEDGMDTKRTGTSHTLLDIVESRKMISAGCTSSTHTSEQKCVSQAWPSLPPALHDQIDHLSKHAHV